jgi:hypothetical protein
MLIVGNYIDNIKCESFCDIATNRIRIRPLKGQGLPLDIVIESLKEYRDVTKYPLGTVYLAKRVKVCRKDKGRNYLRADKQLLEKL